MLPSAFGADEQDIPLLNSCLEELSVLLFDKKAVYKALSPTSMVGNRVFQRVMSKGVCFSVCPHPNIWQCMLAMLSVLCAVSRHSLGIAHLAIGSLIFPRLVLHWSLVPSRE